MAKSVGRKSSGGGRKGPLIFGVLVGFVVLALGVNFRRVYGLKQAKEIREMQQKREALVSEQLKLQDAIRVASDRKHIIEIARSRLGMKMPELNQAKQIREMQQKREALVSEQLKVQDAIRVASDRKHIIEIARSRLGMKMPELNQVIDLPRRPLPNGKE